MYIWNVKALEQGLRGGIISEREQFKYVLFLVIIGGIFVGALASIGGEWNFWRFLDYLMFNVIGIVGAITCYRVNKAGDDKDFIVRYTCLTVPVVVRFVLLITVPLALLIGSFEAMTGRDILLWEEKIIFPTDVAVNSVLNIAFFYFLQKSIGRVAAK